MKERLDGAEYFILADYRGLSVAQSEDLRGRLQKANTKMLVLRNRQFSHVLRGLSFEGFEGQLKGPTAMFYGSGDVVEASKVLKIFAKETEKPVIKLGALEGRLVSREDMIEMADLPSKEQLRSILVCTLAAPMTQLAGVMQQKLASLVYVLQAAQDKKSEGE